MNVATLNRLETANQLSSWVEIDQTALEHNLAEIRKATLPSAEILAVVKANAYGHGLIEIAKLLDKKVAYYGVASVDEALRLREFGMQAPILLFGIHFANQIKPAVESKIILSVSSLEQAELMNEVASEVNGAATVHIKVDTGMGRLGIPLKDALAVIQKIHTLSQLKLEGIYTHFPVSEKKNDSFTNQQIRRFISLIHALDKKGVHFAFRHAANSGAVVNYRDSHLNLVRPGLSLYGIYTDEVLSNKINLKPVLSWRTRVVLVKEIAEGESVGYGQSYIAKEKTNIAILPIGYGQGYPFSLSGKGSVLIHGKSYFLAGRVSMDYAVVDIGNDSIQTGDIVTLLGTDGERTISAELLAQLANTIPYEIVTQIGHQVPRLLV